MAEWTKTQVQERIARGESLERADLRQLDLSGLDLSGTSFRRADLRGTNFGKCVLRRANFSSADMREAFLAGADLREAVLQNADLESANLDGANLHEVDLSRANASGASFERATMSGTRLLFAELDSANLGGANLKGANLSGADLTEAYVGGANLGRANMRDVRMPRANLEKADLTECDLRGADLTAAMLDGCTLSGCRIGGVQASPEQFAAVQADWVDAATDGVDQRKIKGSEIAAYVKSVATGRLFGTPVGAATDANRRYFGEGDLLGNAQLEFGEGSLVEVESRFEKCAITLRPGAKFIVGEHGVLEGCSIQGAGDILVRGRVTENGDTPSLVGLRRVVVAASGSLVATVQQPPEQTRFGLERGCHLRLKILR
jgi:uncharacterized protein YjbI with pentapeptide repeats